MVKVPHKVILQVTILVETVWVATVHGIAQLMMPLLTTGQAEAAEAGALPVVEALLVKAHLKVCPAVEH
jgi:hypothetical protein